MLEIFTKFIKEACDDAIKYNVYGTQSFHIEKIEQIEDKDGAWNFLVTTWNNENGPFEDSRKTKEMNLFDIMDLLGRIIGHLALNDAARHLHKDHAEDAIIRDGHLNESEIIQVIDLWPLL